MDCVIEFSTPYRRSQIATGFVNLNLPSTLAAQCRNASAWEDVGFTRDTGFDFIDAVKISGFADWIDISTFVQSLPAAAFSRVARISFSV